MKSKAEIERDYPIVKPSECPGKVMEWISKKLKAHSAEWTEKLDPFISFIRVGSVVLVGLVILYVLNTIILLIHIKMKS